MTRLRNAWARLTRRPYRYVDVDVAALEDAMAYGLAERVGRRFDLTPAGERVLNDWMDAQLRRQDDA